MNSTKVKTLWAALCCAALSAPVFGQATTYTWVAPDAVADWNVDANWDSVFGNAVPDADAFEGESALINNGRTARADIAVPKVAGLEVRNGGLQILGGGIVETLADDVATGRLVVGNGGAIELSGDGRLIVAGDATHAGTLRLTGPESAMQVAGDFSTTGTLVAAIVGDNHGLIEVDGAANLGGTLQVEVSGSAAFGQSWDLLRAGSLAGRFQTVQATDATPLPRGLQYQVHQDGGTAALQVGNALIAAIDRQSGMATIENPAGAPLEITAYALRSENGLLETSWPGVLGTEWQIANPTANHLAELSLSGSLLLDVGSSLALGNAYAAGPTGPADEDVVLQYATADGAVREGVVEFTGALNDLVLHVDPADGSAAIGNLSRFIETPDLTAYAVRSAAGGLTVGTWTSFNDSGVAGEGWTQANPTSNHLAELNLDLSTMVPNGTLLPLGQIFSPGSEQDLLFQYTTTSGELLTGTVQYGAIPTLEGLLGDCTNDGQLNAADLACVGDLAERDAVLGALNSLPGDLDGSGDVGFADFLVLSANFGTAGGGYAGGDIDLEGTVAFADFLILSANFGQAAGQAVSVPEPNIGVYCFAIVGLAFRRRRG